jgi:outer membrane protein assembly factor BamE
MKISFIACSLLLISCLSACSSLRFPGVYRLEVAQGNYVEQKMVDKLEEGMTRRQVRYVLGTPLVADTFNPDRWDYYYSRRRGGDQLVEHLFSVYFEGDKLAKWEGSYEKSKLSDQVSQEEALQRTKKTDEARF